MLGEGRLQVDGSIDGPPNFDRTDFDVEWHASSIQKLSVLAGMELPDQSLHLVASVIGTQNHMAMEHFEMTLGESDLKGKFMMTEDESLFIDIDVKSKLFDVTAFQDDPADKVEKDPGPRADKAIPDTPLPFDLLRMADADINVSIEHLKTSTVDVSELVTNATIRDGALDITELSLTGARGGRLTIDGAIKPDETGAADVEFMAKGSDLVIGFIAKSEEDLQRLPLFELDSKLAGHGRTVREVAGSLNGYFRMVGAEGSVPVGSFALVTQDFLSEVITAINPFVAKDKYTQVECTVILMMFDDGVLSGKPLLVQQTDKLRIFGEATIDLKTEKVDASFRTVPQKGLGISVSNLVNPYIKISGTLAKPALGLNPEGILIEGGVAVATAGLSILAKGFKDRFLSVKDACGKAVEDYDEKRAAKTD